MHILFQKYNLQDAPVTEGYTITTGRCSHHIDMGKKMQLNLMLTRKKNWWGVSAPSPEPIAGDT